jgi:hypothetical protein
VQTPRQGLDIRTVPRTEISYTRTGQWRPRVEEKVLSESGAEAIVVANWPHKDCGTNALNIYDAEDGNFLVIHIEMLVNQNGRRICLRDHVK